MSNPCVQSKFESLFVRTAEGIKPGLDEIRTLCKALGNPQEKLGLVVHVAGTNGKGSVCALLERLFREHGFATGLYTSPHLIRFNERFKVQGVDISDGELEELIDTVLEADAIKEGQRKGTFFELATAIAFTWFAQKKVDITLVETGLGGRWDATNIVMPVVSVITRIGMDHMDYLGNTLEDIAKEKAGIIKSKGTVVSGAQEEAALEVLQDRAQEQDARFIYAPDFVRISKSKKQFHISTPSLDLRVPSLGLQGAWATENLSTALTVFESMSQGIEEELRKEKVPSALEKCTWPARFERISEEPLVVLDAAHNPAGARALARSLKEQGWEKVIWLCGFLKDKAYPEMILEWRSLWSQGFIVTPAGIRGASAEDVVACCTHHQMKAETVETLESAYQKAHTMAVERQLPLCIAGSIHFLGEILEYVNQDKKLKRSLDQVEKSL